MSTNSYSYSRKTTGMNTKDLAVGQQLVRVVTTGGQWGGTIQRREELVTVTKILKSRLVVTTAAGKAYRVLVRTDSWSHGDVRDILEGQSDLYRRDSFVLFTLDDEVLAADRVVIPARNKAIQTKTTAKTAARLAADNLARETAQAAIDALQAYLKELDA